MAVNASNNDEAGSTIDELIEGRKFHNKIGVLKTIFVSENGNVATRVPK